MVTSREIRAARALLGWTRQRLADKAIVSLNSIIRLEQGAVDSRTSTVNAVRRTLEQAGVEFLSLQSDFEGIRFRPRRRR
ncbi:MAG TPA: helix-turn-helix domain-containing protein [Stellaceae bacterium]|jgi:predicted transcriptional regulator|nr:helix-turn-helix domain-containing protein [Stellaceae bacterium]